MFNTSRSTAMKKIAIFLCLAWSGVVFSQEKGPAPANVVQLSASASQELVQDQLSISLSVTREGIDAAVVQQQLKSALEAALTEARKAVLAGQLEVRTGQFGIYPRYGRDGKTTGWQGTAELVLEGPDFSRIGATVGRLPMLTVGSVTFSLSRAARARAETEVQARAIAQFRERAADIARGFGFSGYTLREVSVGSSEPPQVMRPRLLAMDARAASAEPAMPLEAGRALVSVSVSGTVVLK